MGWDMFKSPFECLCGNFILPEFFEHVYLFALLLNLRKILYLIEKSESDSISEAASTEKSDEEPEKVKYIYQTKCVDFEFVPGEQKSEWKSALVSLLNNEKTPAYEKGGGLDGYSCLYPDRPV